MKAEQLVSGERDRERMRRVAELSRGGAGNVLALLEELKGPGWAVRRAVIAALAELGQPAVAPLCQALRLARQDEAVIAGTVDALAASVGEVEAEVLSLASDENPAVICDAVQILGRRASQRAVSLLAQLTRHENDNVALAAVEALGRIGGAEAVEALLVLAESGNFFRAFRRILMCFPSFSYV